MSITPPEVESLKAAQRALWMAGDYGLIAKTIMPLAEEFAARLDLAPGTRLLDVACGSGNLAVAAARAGAVVTGVDIAANLLEQGRARAASEGLAIRFDEGDAEQLPYDGAAFDVVASIFGAMFAPRPERVAAELLRVCRPGGRIALANWTPTGFSGGLFQTVGRHSPPPPVPSPSIPPPLWGDETVVRERLGDGVADLRMTRRMCSIQYPFPPAEVVAHFRQYFGPIASAFGSLDADGQAALQHDLEQLWSSHNRASDGSTHVEAEYLEVLATRR